MTSPVDVSPVHCDLDLTARFAAQRLAFAGNPAPPAAQRPPGRGGQARSIRSAALTYCCQYPACMMQARVRTLYERFIRGVAFTLRVIDLMR